MIKIRKGDLVEVISGEQKGKRGKVLSVDAAKNRVVVEGVNFVKKHKRLSKQGQPGGIVDIPAPLSVAKLVLLCPRCGKPTRVRRDRVEDRRVRICRLCSEVIDK